MENGKKKVLILEVEDADCRLAYGKLRFYSKDIAVCNMAISVAVVPEIKMDDTDVLPCDNSSFYLTWSGESEDGEALLMENIKLYFDEFFYVKDTGWDFSDLENDTYINYILNNKDTLGVSEFFD